MRKIKRLLKDEIIRKILLFFNENPRSIDTVKGISIWVGDDADRVREGLDRLVKEGILVSHKAASTSAYSYTNQRDTVKKIEECIKKMAGDS